MRVKKSLDQGHLSLTMEAAPLDSDPLTNDNLHQDIWKALKNKISMQMAM
jgi:hypothetical protein